MTALSKNCTNSQILNHKSTANFVQRQTAISAFTKVKLNTQSSVPRSSGNIYTLLARLTKKLCQSISNLILHLKRGISMHDLQDILMERHTHTSIAKIEKYSACQKRFLSVTRLNSSNALYFQHVVTFVKNSDTR